MNAFTHALEFFSTCRHLHSARQGDLVVPGPEQLALDLEKPFNHRSVSMEQSAAGNYDDISDTWTVPHRLKTEIYLCSYSPSVWPT